MKKVRDFLKLLILLSDKESGQPLKCIVESRGEQQQDRRFVFQAARQQTNSNQQLYCAAAITWAESLK